MTAWSQQFQQNESKLAQNSECAEFWVTRARLLMLEDCASQVQIDYGLDEVEKCILKALELEPEHLEAIEEAAHFYDVVIPDRDKAVLFAQRYVQLAGKVVDEMKSIIEGAS